MGRTYQNGQTGEWGESRTLGRSDLLKAQALLLDANREMVKWQQYYKEQQQAQAPQTDIPEQQPEPEMAQSQLGLTAQRDETLANAKPPAPAANPEQEPGPEI